MNQAQDPFGNPVWLQHAASEQPLHDFIEGFLAYEPRLLNILEAAEQDHSPLVQACAAALQMFSESPAGPPAARRHLAKARLAGLPASERELGFAQAVTHWVEGRPHQALALHEQLAREHPRDLASIKLGQYHAFNLGDSAAMLRLALAARHAAADVAWLHGLLAFGFEQCHQLPEAEAAARRALARRAAEPWAEHALAHVMLIGGRLREGADFMQHASGPWRQLTSFMRCHNGWHLALFHIELGDDAAALALYDNEVWGVDKGYSQDQVGAVSLLARLELAGVDVGERWQDLAEHLTARVSDQVQPFLDLHYLYGLARAGRAEADRLFINLQRHAQRAPAEQRQAWQRVAVPAARGLLAHARGLAEPQGAAARWTEAVDQLALALPQLARIGGSHAQRDLFEQVYVDALLRSGALGAVLNLLQPRLNAAPQSVRLTRRVAVVRDRLGLTLPVI